MKFIWEEKDIRAGRHVIAHNDTETWMIGYDPSQESPRHYAIISLNDGMIARKNKTKTEIADFLNESGSKPVSMP